MLCGPEGTCSCYLTEEDVIGWRFQTRIIGDCSVLGLNAHGVRLLQTALFFLSCVPRAWQYIRLYLPSQLRVPVSTACEQVWRSCGGGRVSNSLIPWSRLGPPFLTTPRSLCLVSGSLCLELTAIPALLLPSHTLLSQYQAAQNQTSPGQRGGRGAHTVA